MKPSELHNKCGKTNRTYLASDYDLCLAILTLLLGIENGSVPSVTFQFIVVFAKKSIGVHVSFEEQFLFGKKEADNSEQPYTRPSCGQVLYKKCEECQHIRHSLLLLCEACSDQKEIR